MCFGKQCDLLGAVDQLISNQVVLTDAGSKNISVSVSQFPAFAAGCLLYLSSPDLVCAAAAMGQWGNRTNAFVHKLTHTEEQDGHEHMDLSGLTVLIHELHHHYEPLNTEVSSRRVPPAQTQSQQRRRPMSSQSSRAKISSLQLEMGRQKNYRVLLSQ